MSRPAQIPPTDARLESLLEVERRLEARVRAAETRATERVSAAREAVQRLDDEMRVALEEEARQEEQRDVEAHARELRSIGEQREAVVARLESVPDAVVERLAGVAYGRVIGGGESP